MTHFAYYYCSGCKKRVKREVRYPPPRFIVSYCETAKSHFRLRLSRDQTKPAT